MGGHPLHAIKIKNYSLLIKSKIPSNFYSFLGPCFTSLSKSVDIFSCQLPSKNITHRMLWYIKCWLPFFIKSVSHGYVRVIRYPYTCAGGICTINAFSKTEILPCWCSMYFFCLIITQTKAPSLGRVKCLVFSRIKPNPVMDWLLNDAGVAWGSVYVSFSI